MSAADRNIFENDKKLLRLCEDFIHQVDMLEEKEKNDPEMVATPAKIIAAIRYDNDPEPLTMDEYNELTFFLGDRKEGYPNYADWKLALIETSASGYVNEDGTPKFDII